MKCIHCQGCMEKGSTFYHVDRKGYHLVLDTVPAWVCRQCGEACFEEGDVRSIQNLILSVDQQTSKLPKSA